jgi:hypothetical protein
MMVCNGLAASVRKDLPEDSIIIDLDTGEVECALVIGIYLFRIRDIIPESAKWTVNFANSRLCRR